MCACNNTQLPNDDNKQSQSENSQQTPSEDNQQTPNDDDPADTKYKLTVIDYWGYLVKPLDEYYTAGEEVEVTFAFLSPNICSCGKPKFKGISFGCSFIVEAFA